MPLFYVPSRDSRHRVACFALYKALLRQGARVQLPSDLATTAIAINPINYVIRGGFKRNMRDTSPRLVISALKNGYKFLDLLTKAEDTSSREYSAVLAFLRENEPRAQALRDKLEAAKATPPSTPNPGTIPLLTLHPLSTSDDPVYVSTLRPRPLSEIKGDLRKVPTLDHSMGVPFLRLTKPQPHALSRVIFQRSMRGQRLIEMAKELEDEVMPDAVLEDAWDAAMERLAPPSKRKKGDDLWNEREPSFRDEILFSLQELGERLNKDRHDLVARGKALWKIVEEEQALADQERVDRELATNPKLTRREEQNNWCS